jgi:hypothetical protein
MDKDKSLQDLIDGSKNGLLGTQNLQIRNQQFLTEVISDYYPLSRKFKSKIDRF